MEASVGVCRLLAGGVSGASPPLQLRVGGHDNGWGRKLSCERLSEGLSEGWEGWLRLRVVRSVSEPVMRSVNDRRSRVEHRRDEEKTLVVLIP